MFQRDSSTCAIKYASLIYIFLCHVQLSLVGIMVYISTQDTILLILQLFTNTQILNELSTDREIYSRNKCSVLSYQKLKKFQFNGVKLSQKFTGMNVLIYGAGFCYGVSYLIFVKIQFKMVRAFLKYVLHHHLPRHSVKPRNPVII